MRLMSVIHFPQYGGPHNANALLIPMLRMDDIETTVVLPDSPGNAAGLLRERGIDTVQMSLSRLRAVSDPATHIRFTRQFRSEVRQLRGLMRALKVDVVMVNGLVNPHAAVAGRLENVPVVWQLLDTFAPMTFRHLMMPFVTRLADVIMSTGRAVAEAHPGTSKLGERLVVFFPPVDTARFVMTETSRRNARSRLNIPQDCLVVGSIANINPMKGHDIFIRAAARLRRLRPGTRFLILGAQAANHAAYIDALWSSAAQLGLELGRDLVVADPGRDVAGTAPALDVFWLTSNPRSEGVPTVIGEAMALELPVVASRVGSVGEAVNDGVTGRLVPTRDPDALVAATLPYLDDFFLRQSVGRSARARAERLYSPRLCAERHELAFGRAIEHCQRRRTLAKSMLQL
jgi:glycosyltransferase involved in cell wall biosynthesis